MFENIIPSLTYLTDKILKAALGTVTIVLVIVSSFTGKSTTLPKQTLKIDQISLKELKMYFMFNIDKRF